MCDTKLWGMSEKWQGKATIQKDWRNSKQVCPVLRAGYVTAGCFCWLDSSAEPVDSHQLEAEHESAAHPCSKRLKTFCTASARVDPGGQRNQSFFYTAKTQEM